MMNSAFLAFLELDRQRVLAPTRSAATRIDHPGNEDWETDLLARELAGDFPLHGMGELRRVIDLAAHEVAPRNEPSFIIDRARERLQTGVLS